MQHQTVPQTSGIIATIRALLAAGWRNDSVYQAGGNTCREMLHPSGREITARTSVYGDDTSLTMTGLTLDQVAGAINGAGLGEPAKPELPAPAFMSCPRNCGVDVRQHNSSDLVLGECDTDAITYRVTFHDVEVDPLTMPGNPDAPRRVEQLAAAIRCHLADSGYTAEVTVHPASGTATVRDEDDNYDLGEVTITGPGIGPQPKPDYWLTLADDLRTAADRIATLAGTETRPASVTLTVLGGVLDSDAERMVPLVDALAAAFDTTAAISDERRDQHRAKAEVGAVQFQAYTYIPVPEDPEKAAMRAELDALRAQLAEGGATR